MVDYHAVEEGKDHGEIGLRWFYFNFFNKDEKAGDREGSSEFPYLLMLIKIWPGNGKNQLNIKN